jgi:hypothetical protein
MPAWGLGLRGFWMTYFAFHAAPLGAVGAEPVIVCFARFESGMSMGSHGREYGC